MSVALVSTVINAPADEVWARIADFTGWHTWLPRIVATRMTPGGEGGPVGSVRHLTLSDGSEVHEQLLARDDLARHFAYTFVGATPFRVHRYVGAVTVHPATTTRTPTATRPGRRRRSSGCTALSWPRSPRRASSRRRYRHDRRPGAAAGRAAEGPVDPAGRPAVQRGRRGGDRRPRRVQVPAGWTGRGTAHARGPRRTRPPYRRRTRRRRRPGAGAAVCPVRPAQ